MTKSYPPRITTAHNDILVADDGRELIDMFSGHGAAFLGHANPALTSSLSRAAEGLWNSGGLETPIRIEARQGIESFFPSSHEACAIYSTGMEAAEFAIRVARGITKANGVIGFEHAMHGKSLATSYLGWDNRDNVQLPDFCRLPFVSSYPEEEILKQVRDVLVARSMSAVFVEPLHGTRGGYAASDSFYQELFQICREHEALLVFDEILTGFYRTGTPFYLSDLGFVPDIVLVGKAMGNGFPVAGVVVNKQHRIKAFMLPGSTFAGNPLASAAIASTLRQMATMDLAEVVGRIEKTILRGLDRVREVGAVVRGKGALWIVEIPPPHDAKKIAASISQRDVFLNATGPDIRLLPAATIEPSNLEHACAVIADEVISACRRLPEAPG